MEQFSTELKAKGEKNWELYEEAQEKDQKITKLKENILNFRLSNHSGSVLNVRSLKLPKLKSLFFTEYYGKELEIIPSQTLKELELDYLYSLNKLTINETSDLEVLKLERIGRRNHYPFPEYKNQPNLTTLTVNGQLINKIEVTNIVNLTHLDLGGNELKELNILENRKLISLDVSNNQLTNLDITRNDKLIVQPENFYQSTTTPLKLRVLDSQVKD
ncbi:12479_t:CDS:1 [Entrophospora sp. SA101]|nr:6482_t:CDS:1 [Entrophospora sp. SA101]CAJ0748969.1 12479_t:CDS:1 [Entrophospora sp. SA101]CAJ0890405.1 10222_t:CDS:1 [Entrophospora sp. SA101]CAJ0925545.1 19193_t:CDS:1 [Entrophospora sp. SA101]